MSDTDLHVPAHIQMTIRIAEQETKTATAWTIREAELRGQFDEHQRDAAAERERIEAELQAARADAQRRLDALAEVERKLTAELAEAGRCREHHGREALDAQQSVADWCTRHGVRPDEIPQPEGTGPLPVVPVRAASPIDGPQGDPFHPAVDPFDSPCVRGEHARCAGCDECPQGCHPETSQPLPVLDTPDALLEQGRRMADPGTTRTDLPGGDQPADSGAFQGPADA